MSEGVTHWAETFTPPLLLVGPGPRRLSAARSCTVRIGSADVRSWSLGDRLRAAIAPGHKPGRLGESGPGIWGSAPVDRRDPGRDRYPAAGEWRASPSSGRSTGPADRASGR